MGDGEGRASWPKAWASNSIVDSGINPLNRDRSLLNAILGMLSPAQRQRIETSLHGEAISNADLNLADWPTLTFVLQGISAGADVVLHVPPPVIGSSIRPSPGQAIATISQGQDGLAILGLPLMNGYFTIFDGAADWASSFAAVRCSTPRGTTTISSVPAHHNPISETRRENGRARPETSPNIVVMVPWKCPPRFDRLDLLAAWLRDARLTLCNDQQTY
jgi:hypothetical protein